jgi:zinc transporter
MLDTISAKSDPDFSGLSFAYRFRDGQAAPLAGRDIAAALAESGGWIWIHLSLVDIEARNWITKIAPLPERAREIFAV